MLSQNYIHSDKHRGLSWQEAGTEIEPMGDLNTEAEKKLGRLVKEKYANSACSYLFASFQKKMWFDNLLHCL